MQSQSSGFHHRNQILDLTMVVEDLRRTEMITKAVADTILSRSRSQEDALRHPLSYLASLGLKDLDIDSLGRWLAQLANQPYLYIDPLKIDASSVTPIMSKAYAVRHQLLAVEVTAQHITIASAQPWLNDWEENLRHTTGKSIRRVVANPEDIERYIHEFYNLADSISGASALSSAGELSNFEQLLEVGSQSSLEANDQHVVSIVDWLLQYAFEQRASDIHIEPRKNQSNLRFRIDGVLHTIYQMPSKVAAAVTSRLKILGRMDVAEKRKPQDGRLKTRNPDGNEVELRLSTLPTAFGEKMVMRVFDPEVLLRPFSQLGFSKKDSEAWQGLVQHPHGIILVTGPTGSGKTTTLYSTLKHLATEKVNVCTVEDPIEMIEPSLNQMQVQHNIDLGFATGVRALLRQDPDIIMIGEIRDLETAQMATQAALTGHLVLSTLHTNDAPSAIIRLLELGVPDYLLKNTVLGVMAQRLVRVLCPQCKEATEISDVDWKQLTQPWTAALPQQVFKPKGCLACRQTGYRGRAGLYEILQMNDTIRQLIAADTDPQQLLKQCRHDGMQSLRLSGAQKVAKGITSVEEVLRVTTA